MTSASRIAIVDPCPVVLTGFETVARRAGLPACFTSRSVRQTLDWLDEHSPDLIVTDFELPDGTAIDLQRAANRQGTPLLLFSSWDNPVYTARMVQAGARGLISKSASIDDLLDGMRSVMQGNQLWKRRDSRRITAAMSVPRLKSHIEFPLTKREFEVLREMAHGRSNKIVAERLGIGYETVKEHVQRVLSKLAVSDRTQAAVMAARHGLL